jgi:hypothetical protein
VLVRGALGRSDARDRKSLSATRSLFRAISIAGVLALVACSPTPIPSAQPSLGELTIHCGDVFVPVECQAISAAALAAASGSGLSATDVWVRGFTLCVNEKNLFDMQTLNCPVPPQPTGGEWSAGVEIAFGGAIQHAGVNVAEIGGQYRATLVGYRVPDPGWCEWLEDCAPIATP